MKEYRKEIIILIIHLLVYYLLPLTAGPTDAGGLVVLLIFLTLLLSIIIGIVSKSNNKWFYPMIISVLFIPTVFIYYNESALVYAIWFLVDSYIGLSIGHLIGKVGGHHGKE